jgi:hypothetical protein
MRRPGPAERARHRRPTPPLVQAGPRRHLAITPPPERAELTGHLAITPPPELAEPVAAATITVTTATGSTVMTDRMPGRAPAPVWILAPVTAGLLAVSTNWAIEHNPLAAQGTATAASSAPVPPPVPPRLRTLQTKLDMAIARYSATHRSLVAVERSLRHGETRLAAVRAAQRSGRGSAPGSGVRATAPPRLPALPAAASPSAPPPPHVSTTTGAS